MYISNYLYFKLYLTYINLDVAINSSKVIYFYNNIFSIIFNNLIGIILLIIPFILCIIFTHKSKIDFNIKNIKLFVLIIISYILPVTIININVNENDIYSYNNLYNNINFPVKNLCSFGLLTSYRLDIQRKIFDFKEDKIVSLNNNKYSKDEYNILDIEFKNSSNNEINEINDYIKNVEPTNKNFYTGILKDKNLIFILAESFNTIAINKDITPNLYMLVNDGFKFNNFYNPLYPVSTADGQYLTDISLYPSDIEHSLLASNENYYPYSLANILKSKNYKTYSYHNYKYDYYSRHIYYPNMGFDVYKGIGNGLNMEDTRSDYDMAVASVDDYITEDKFFVYYLTISGHAPYNEKNQSSVKNYNLLKKYNYSDNVKYYLASQIELDNMLGEIISKLKEKNKLDDTVIVLVPDHVPYGLNIDEMNELNSTKRDNEFEKYKSTLILYNENINKYNFTDKYCFNIDILPTLLNLYGIEYDSRLLMGKDIFSNNESLVVFGNRNFITKDYKYSNMNDIIYGDLNRDKVNDIKKQLYYNFKISRLMLENDYYKYLFK